jgi:hypothetical protein
MAVKVVVNGKKYTDPATMPGHVRKLYEGALRRALVDADGNGLPDILEGPAGPASHTVVRTRLFYNGREYDSVDALPPEVRGAHAEAMSTLRTRQGGAAGNMPRQPADLAGLSARPIEPEAGLRLASVGAVLAILALLGAAVAWLLAGR